MKEMSGGGREGGGWQVGQGLGVLFHSFSPAEMIEREREEGKIGFG